MTAHAAPVLKNVSLRIEAANREAKAMFGFEDEDLSGRHLRELIPGIMAMIGSAGPGGEAEGRAKHFDSSGKHRSGSSIPLEILISKSHLNRRPVLVAMTREKTAVMARKET